MSYKLLVAALLIAPVIASAQTQPQTQKGQASYFNAGKDGNSRTASGAPVEPDKNTAASPTLPMGSKATVKNERNGKSTDVTVTDRGPTRPDRVIDLSKKAAGDVGMTKSGTAPVTVQPKAP